MRKHVIAIATLVAVMIGVIAGTFIAVNADAATGTGFIKNVGTVSITVSENYLGNGQVAGPTHAVAPGATLGGGGSKPDIDAVFLNANGCIYIKPTNAKYFAPYTRFGLSTGTWIKVNDLGAEVKRSKTLGSCTF